MTQLILLLLLLILVLLAISLLVFLRRRQETKICYHNHHLPASIDPCNQEEIDAIENAMIQFRKDWGFHASFGLRNLIGKWVDLVNDVQHPYVLSLADYTHSLSLRDELDEMLSTFPDRLSKSISEFLAAQDAIFFANTRVARAPLLDFDSSEISQRWLRVPTIVAPDVGDDTWYGV
jgi:hypothetical protein